MIELYSCIKHLLIFILVSVNLADCQSQNATYLRTQYINDIEHLNEKIQNFQLKQQSYLNVLTLPNQTQPIDNTVYLEAQTVWLGQNQMAEFSYQNIQQNIININIHQAILTDQDIQNYQTAQDHYKLNNSHFNPSNLSEFGPCKVNDPQIQLNRFRSVFIGDSDFVKSFNQQKVLVHLTILGEYRVLKIFRNTIQLYVIKLDIGFDLYSRTELYVTNSILVDQIQSNEQTFLFQYQKDKIFIYSNRTIFQVTLPEDKLKVQKYAQISLQKQNQSLKDQNHQSMPEKPRKIFPLKFGFLIQFETYFQIYQEQIQQNKHIRKFIPKISIPDLKKLTKSQPIISVVVSQQLSHQSGYKIYVLLQSSVLIEFQYGSYSSINLYRIPYGQNFHHLTVSDDIVEITFSVIKSKKTYFYAMQLLIDRKQNPRTPTILLNRFYNDLKDLKKVEFFEGKQLLVIGETDVLVYDWPINTQVLLKENITQTPYHFAVAGLESIYSLERYSTKDSNYVLLVNKKQMTLAKLSPKPQTIECASDKSFDSRIEILKFCDSNKNQVCKYIASMRVLIENPDSERINTLKRYLIIGLTIAILILIFVVLRQICRNNKTIQKLQKLKDKINSKYNELEVKGKKISQEDKFQELHEELPQHGKTSSDNNNQHDKFQQQKQK